MKYLKIFSAVIFLVFIIAYPLWLPAFYRYLDVSQSARPVDVIVVLGGSSGNRETYAAQLYHQDYAPKVIISGHAETMDYNIRVIRENGVPQTALIINDHATSTYNEAQQVLEILVHLKADSVVIVTDRFHTRRASATYKHVFAGYNIELTFVSPNDDFTADNWWNSNSNHGIMLEYPKMLYYWLAYGVWSG